ncbi:MAG: GntR family transcriptional regulator [Desulfotalea sp.]|nr:MAG: GntR family transcriptional regulator [Desulfotalea sp.]
MNIRPIKPRRISSQVFEQIRELIYRGDFKSGQQIPPERELATSMQVSRTSVRNAIEKLVHLGLLKQVQGQGTFVSSPEQREGNPLSAGMSTDEATFFDLLEVRIGLECKAAHLAALRATDSDIRGIAKSLREMEEGLADNGAISTASDTAFHMAITFSTKNPVLIHLTRNFYDFLFVGIKKNLCHMEEIDLAFEEVLSQHREVFAHIKAREPQKAYDAMHRHLVYVQDLFERRNIKQENIPLKHLAA